LKSGERERHGVDAGPQVDNLVLAGAVGDALRDRSISTGLDASTLTPGSTASEVSFTTPAIALCARADAGTMRSRRAAGGIHRRGIMKVLLLRKIYG
jgi:hypothetical protein